MSLRKIGWINFQDHWLVRDHTLIIFKSGKDILTDREYELRDQ